MQEIFRLLPEEDPLQEEILTSAPPDFNRQAEDQHIVDMLIDHGEGEQI